MPTILITGANRGLGLEFTRQYAADNWRIIATCRNPGQAPALQQLAQQHNSIQIEQLDITDAASIAALAVKLDATALDILLNNAGIYGSDDHTAGPRVADLSQTFGTLDAAAWDKVLRFNTIAPVMVTQAFTPHAKRGAMKKIIFISSRMGSIAQAASGAIAYRTSKAALNAAMRNIAQALQSDNIITASFHPGWVQTDMGGANADITPEVSIAGMRKVIAGLTQEQSGAFLAYNGETLPW